MFSAFWTKIWNRFAYIICTYIWHTYEYWLPNCCFMMKFICYLLWVFGGRVWWQTVFSQLPGGHDGGAAWKIRFGGAFSRRIFSWRWMMIHYGGFQKSGYPKMDGFIMENPIKMDDLGVPLFSETSLWLIWLVYSDLWWCYQWLPDWSDWICSLLFAEFPSVSI